MATTPQLRKFCDDSGFTSNLNKLGFHLGPENLWYYRVRGKYLDIISFWLSSSKKSVTIPIDCQKIELIDHYDMSSFPKGFNKNYDLNSDCFIDDEELSYASWTWEVEKEHEIKETFTEVLKLIKSHAENWFQNITTDEEMYYSYSLRIQESDFGQDLKSKLNVN